MIYLISDGNYYKIGHSKNPEKRLAQLQTGQGRKLFLVKTWETDNDLAVEKRLHKMFWQNKTRGEWFNFSQFHLDFLHEYLNFLSEYLPVR